MLARSCRRITRNYPFSEFARPVGRWRKNVGTDRIRDKEIGLASLRILYLAGMITMPPAVQYHLRLCENNPTKCLLCQMTQFKIQALRLTPFRKLLE